jgi:DNA helicase-2/ATP-dependent DNA helicase PcrA
VQVLADVDDVEKPKAIMNFFEAVFGGLDQDEKRFFGGLLRKNGRRPMRADRRMLWDRHKEGVTASLLLDLLEYVAQRLGKPCKLKESTSALKCILEASLDSSAGIKVLYADEIARRKYQNRANVYRCVGSTLLVKGLQFDHAIVLRSPGWQKNWGSHKDLYVALTRGAKSAMLIDLTN